MKTFLAGSNARAGSKAVSNVGACWQAMLASVRGRGCSSPASRLLPPERAPLYLVCAALGVLLAGCNIIPPPSADPTRYYVLSGPALVETAPPSSASTLKLGLRNVELAPYLRKGTLVVRTGENEVTFPSDARWGVPLEQDIARTLRTALLAAPPVGRVFVPPFPFEGDRDFDVSVQVIRCEGVVTPGGKTGVAKLAAWIEITTAGAGPQVVARKLFIAPETPWDGKDFAQLAAQLSAAVTALGHEVVGALPEKK